MHAHTHTHISMNLSMLLKTHVGATRTAYVTFVSDRGDARYVRNTCGLLMVKPLVVLFS